MPPRSLLVVVFALVAAGCDRASAAASDSPAGSVTAAVGSVDVALVLQPPPTEPASAPPVASEAPAAPRPVARPRGACGATRVIAAGETLAGISQDCYGSRAYADRLQRKNGLKSATVKAGASLATPPIAELFAPCAPREVCEPILAAYAAFLPAQAITEHAATAPDAARPALERTKRLLEDALRAAEVKKVKKPRTQLKAAIEEVEGLRSGAKHEPSYPEHAFHQHLVFALDALTG